MQMKDGLGQDAIMRIALALNQLINGFNVKRFEREALQEIDGLELKERVNYLIHILNQYLPDKFTDCAALLMQLPDVWDFGDPDDALRGFAAWPLIDYIAVYGLKAPKTSLRVLQKLTSLFSAEFAIRPFILNHPQETFTFLDKWLEDSDEHVRRLVSEGTRPRLPWGIQLKPFIKDPQPILPLLAQLRHDSSQYVKRSVANNLNDIAKDHPGLLIDTCTAWQNEDKGSSDWVISHATRTLVKNGHPDVFALLGYTKKPSVSVAALNSDKPTVKLGDNIGFSFEIESHKTQQSMVVDYAVHYMKANGTHSAKVFKLKNVTLDQGQKESLQKNISFKKISTRKFYVGTHFIAVHINGVEKMRIDFELTKN